MASAGCAGNAPAEENPGPSADAFLPLIKKLVPIHEKKRPSGPSDWLANHKEKGQTFAQYVGSDPVKPDKKRHTLYILLLGDFQKEQREIVSRTALFLKAYFHIPVKFTDALDLSVIPSEARRRHPSWGVRQINGSYILDEVLKPRVPKDAVALIAFTAHDLWPGPGWNFVFGLASLRERVGVWSIHRFGDPTAGDKAYRLCLLRTLKTGTHETGHMLGIRHCIRYECNMNGSNHLAESDQGPLALCPECVAKVWWACRCDPVKRFRDLEAFCRGHKLKIETDFYKKSGDLIAPLWKKNPEEAKAGKKK
jgi:archaemetzincin